MDYEERIRDLGLELPEVPQPAGSYDLCCIEHNLVFLSGQLSKDAQGNLLSGRVGEGVSLENGQKAAEAAALQVISVIKHSIGFNRINRLVRLVGYVQVSEGFHDISQVVNGASDVFIRVFGDKGRHTRSVVGVKSLPMNAVVELEAILAVTKG
ncbi:MAG: RidA family protein [Candidatus Omnitrophica bacterium]|nr:RidA family protein [Candidatus Omnitrophota bacterium]